MYIPTPRILVVRMRFLRSIQRVVLLALSIFLSSCAVRMLRLQGISSCCRIQKFEWSVGFDLRRLPSEAFELVHGGLVGLMIGIYV